MKKTMTKSSLPPIKTSPDYLSPDYTDIIDVRSPSEFTEDHIPGAINLPVLDDQQRIEVGTLYKESPFEAKKLGASYVSANIAKVIGTHLQDKDAEFRPLIYCWRGGQRSRSMAITLNQVGWHVTLLDGGYKNYRSQVRANLSEQPQQFQIRILNGLTGTAKTEILSHLAALGEQVLDLEGLAHHKGSLLGFNPDKAQPSQKLFESRITATLKAFSTDKIIWVESESNKIGNLHVPEKVWAQMKSAPQIEVIAPVSARIKHIIKDYRYLTENPVLLGQKLAYIKHRVSRAIYESWQQLISDNQWEELVESLLLEHYDPSYQRSMANNQRQTLGTEKIESLDEASLARLASRISRL